MRICQVSNFVTSNQLSDEKRKLKEACRDLEAIFLSYLLKSMRKTVQEADLFGSRREEGLFRDMLDTEICTLVSRAQSLGIADMLYRELSRVFDRRSGADHAPRTGDFREKQSSLQDNSVAKE